MRMTKAEKLEQKLLKHLDKQEERRYKKEAEKIEKEKLEAMKDGDVHTINN